MLCRVGDEWRPLPDWATSDAETAVLLFGLCTAWRSNDRIRAAEHRVGDVTRGGTGSPRRLSAVLFMGECSCSG